MSAPLESGSAPVSKTWRNVAIVALFAVVAVAGLDIALARLSAYPRPRREVDDAISDMRQVNPTVLVIGSSHARTFDQVGAEVAKRTAGQQRIVAVPLEWGKLSSYEWLLNHRVWPELGDKSAVRHAILLTEWWDSCAPGTAGGYVPNLPARAWTTIDFLEDVRQNGLNAYNRNFLQYHWSRLMRVSVLVRNRSQQMLLPLLRQRFRPVPADEVASDLNQRNASWQRAMERGAQCIGDSTQMQSLRNILTSFQARGIDVTIILYPRKPGTISPLALSTTLSTFADEVRRIAEPYGAAVVDMTTTSPLTDADFADDFDHVTREGNEKYTDWALAGALSWLVNANSTAGPPVSSR